MQTALICNQPFTDTSATGTYTVTYSATDTSGNTASTSQVFTVGSSGWSSGALPAAQNKANQTTKNVTVTVPATANTTNTPQEPEIKTKANDKIREAKARLEDMETRGGITADSAARDSGAARRLLGEAEAAFSAGDYSKAYNAVLEAEGLIGKNVTAEKEPEKPKPLYTGYVIALLVIIAGVYAARSGSGILHKSRKDDKEPPAPLKPKNAPMQQKSRKQNSSKDKGLADIEKHMGEIRRKPR